MRVVFFKLNKHRQFTYKPIFYDPQKEEFEERVKKVKAELGMFYNELPYVPKFTRGSFRKYSKVLNKEYKKSLIRIIVITLILILLVYLFFILS